MRQVTTLFLVLVAFAAIAIFASATKMAGSSPPLNKPTLGFSQASSQPLEGCLKCHAQIEPMHRYGPTVAGALDKLNNGKDGLGLTCTACHGGNPVANVKEEAHVQPRYPREWMRAGKVRVPENSGP